MATPVPKPRTKFENGAEINNLTISPEPPQNPPQKSPQNPEDVPESVSPPAVPPRPPAKPPRVPQSSQAIQNFGNVLGELRVNLGAPPDIGRIAHTDNGHDCTISPPTRHAPPPPRPPPPVGWKAELGQKPMVPERVQSHSNRPLPAIPLESPPPSSGPSTSSSIFQPVTIENPLYLTLDNYRSISGITPSPTHPPTTSPDCEELREWLTEEEEAESHQNRPEELPMSSEIPANPTSSSEENPYTPCPRRSDYSGGEFSDPFDDAFFHNQNQNVYVSPEFERKSTSSEAYENVVETCRPEDVENYENSKTESQGAPVYVNVNAGYRTSSDSEDVNEWGLKEKPGTLKIDGSVIAFVGFVMMTSTKREKRLHCRLRNMQLSFHEDEESMERTHGPFDIKDIYMFRQIEIPTSSGNASTSSATSSGGILLHIGEKRHVISFHPEDPSNLWMFFISEAWLSLNFGLTPALRDADELVICGNVWVKHGATDEWRNCSAGINRMKFYYMYSEARDRILHRNSLFGGGEEMVEVDLRMVMTMRDKIDKSEFCPHLKHKRGPFSVTLCGVTLYIDSRDDSTTSHWYDAIDSMLKKPATRLENMRLTGDYIPVIVDKCIRFVSAFGMKSEGIYRRNGKVTEAKTILAKLQEDPVGFYPVQETDESVYAVADVLRQFFRKLDEPIFPLDLQTALFDLAREPPSDELWTRYAEIIKQLPKINHATLKRVIGHLKNVGEHSEENRASPENLAKVFAATLFRREEEKLVTESFHQQISTMLHLINGYDLIFQISVEEELSRQMVADAEKKAVNTKKPSSDFIVAIHVWEKENRPFNVAMSLASEEVIREAVVKRGFDGPLDSNYAVFECIGPHLTRRLRNSQKMSTCVMQWIDWNCKDGYLLFDHDKWRFDSSDMTCFTGKIKIAEPGSKTFKSYEVKIENGVSIVAFRNEKPWKTWPMESVVWYIGADPTRKPPNTHNCTMISLAKDGFTAKMPGFCFSFKEETERSRWMTALQHFSKSLAAEPLVYI